MKARRTPHLAASRPRTRSRSYDHEPGDAKPGLARRGRRRRFDLVCAVGGDGTVNETINGLAGSDTPLAIIPTGTVNVLAMELGIPLEPPDASSCSRPARSHGSTSAWPATATSVSWPASAWTPPSSPRSTRR